MNVISQMTSRRTRPMQRDLPSEFLGRPHYGSANNPRSHNSGASNEASLPQLNPCASALLYFFFSGPRKFFPNGKVPREAHLANLADSQTRIDVLFHFE